MQDYKCNQIFKSQAIQLPVWEHAQARVHKSKDDDHESMITKYNVSNCEQSLPSVDPSRRLKITRKQPKRHRLGDEILRSILEMNPNRTRRKDERSPPLAAVAQIEGRINIRLT
jgi:hypothetical protein